MFEKKIVRKHAEDTCLLYPYEKTVVHKLCDPVLEARLYWCHHGVLDKLTAQSFWLKVKLSGRKTCQNWLIFSIYKVYMLRLVCGVLRVQLELFSYFSWDPKFAPLYKTRSDTVLFESLCHRSFFAFQEDNAAPYTADNSVRVWTYSFCALCWFFNLIKSHTFVAQHIHWVLSFR